MNNNTEIPRDRYAELTKNYAGRVVAVLILITAAAVSGLLIHAGAQIGELKWFIITAAALAGILLLADAIEDRRLRPLHEKKKELSQSPYTFATLTELRKYTKYFIKERQVGEFDRSVRHKNRLYRFVAEYTDPVSGQAKRLLTRPYWSKEPEKHSVGDRVKVYYTPDGEATVEL